MAYFRISELTQGVVPVPAAALLEISAPDGTTISGYDSHRVTVSEFFTDITLSGSAIAPTQPPGSNNNFIATTEYVDHAVAVGVAAAPYVELAGDTMTGDLHAPHVQVTGEFRFQDRTGAELWALYTQAGVTRLFSGGNDHFTVDSSGDAVVGRNLTVLGGLQVNGDANISGYTTVSDFQSHANVFVPNGYGYFGLYVEALGDVFAHQSLYTGSVGDAGPSTTRGFLGGTFWRFKQDAGDDREAGSISYRTFDASALNIVGAGVAGGAGRRVRVWDFLDVGGGGYYGYTLNINYQILFQRSGSGSTLQIYDDGNSHIEGTSTMWIQSSGQLTRFGGHVSIYANDGLYIQAPTGGNARVLSDVYGVRVWSVGTLSTGSFQIGDESAGKAGILVGTDSSCYNQLGTWYAMSDAALKQDVEPFDRGLAALVALRARSFRYRAGTPFTGPDEPGPRQIGLLADEVREHLPEICGEIEAVIDGEPRSVATLAPGLLVYPMLNALREINERLVALEGRK